MSAVFTGNVLVVEDNIVIAMDAEDVVASLGASAVFAAASVAEAEQVLNTETISAAVLDYNLDDQTSEPIADRLMSEGIPFVFATGYSGLEQLPERFQGQILLEKPFTADDIRDAFARTTASPIAAGPVAASPVAASQGVAA